MKKIILFSLITLFIFSCGSIKKTKEALNSGNYSKAIALSVKNLKKNKTKKGNQPYVLILEEAYDKASERDLERIKYLKKDTNPENLELIYSRYKMLEKRQNTIKPLLPLYIVEQRRNASFVMTDYSSQIIKAKNKVSKYLYDKALVSFDTASKEDIRKKYNDLEYIERINPNYKDTRNLMNQAHNRGLDYVFVSMKNQTEKVIPKKLEEVLLNFETYGLNDIWTVYHNSKDKNIVYDFSLELNLRKIEVSPEQIKEKEIYEEKQIKDGYKYLLDDDGNQVKDKDGKKIEVDNMVTVTCNVEQITQFKSARVVALVKYYNSKNNQLLEMFPIESEFVFEHIYANYNGDRRAIRSVLLDYLRQKVVPFPSNEQMIFDTGSDLKQKLKAIITENKFR